MRCVRSLKLQQFCLHVIVENLEKFISCKDIPQKHIDFLFRVYSEEVFKRLKRSEIASEDTVLWFLNPYIKKIPLYNCTERIIRQLQIVGTTIISLDLRKSSVTENMINSVLSCVPNVTHLDLSKTKCSDNTLLCIKKMCPAVISLELFECDITGGGLGKFCDGNQALRSLNLIGTDIEESDMYLILNKVAHLDCLKYDELPQMLHEMKKSGHLGHAHYNFTELILEYQTEFETESLIHSWTVLCPNVRKVFINFAISEKALRMCAKFQNLEELEINFKKCEGDSDDDKWYLPWQARSFYVEPRFSYATNILASLIPLGSRLRVLKLCNAKIDIKILVEKFHNLKTLGLQKVAFTDFAENDIVLNENNLETLVLQEVKFSDDSNCKAIQVLFSLSKNVKELGLPYCYDVPQNMFDLILNSMKRLSFVSFNSDISSYCILKFAEMPSMTKMYLDGFVYDTSDIVASDFISINRKVHPLYPTNTLSWSYCYIGDSDDDDDEDYYDSDDDSEETFFTCGY